MLPRKITPTLYRRLHGFPAVALVRRFLVCQRSDRIETGSQVVCDLGGPIGYIEWPS